MDLPPIEWILCLCVAPLPLYYASAIAHEAGHALMARLCGFIVMSLGMGTERPFCVFSLGHTRVYLARTRPLQGLTFWFGDGPSRGSLVLLSLGGIAVNLFIAAVSLALFRIVPRGREFWGLVGALNAFLGLVNLVPVRLKVGNAWVRSDGALALQVLRRGTVSSNPPQTIEFATGLLPLWQSIGDTISQRLFLRDAGLAFIELGDLDRAEAFCSQADAIQVPHLQALAAWEALVAAQLALGTQAFDRVLPLLATAEQGFRSGRNEEGQVAAAILRAALRSRTGDAAGALNDLDTLAQTLGRRPRPNLAVALLEARIECVASLGDLQTLIMLCSEYERFRMKSPSLSRNVRVYARLARAHRERGDWSSANAANRIVLENIRVLAGSWIDPTERAKFLHAQAALFTEIRNGFVAEGKGEEAEQLLAPLESPEGSAASDRAAALRRERRRWRIGFGMLLVDVGVVAAVTLYFALTQNSIFSRDSGPLVVSAAMAGMFAIVAIVYLGFYLTAARFIPALRSRGSGVFLILSGLGWGGSLINMALALIGPH